jgi:tRNA U34 5-methylaminomethyl-2-thiouridine-forming methyltransferase MnmC
MESKYTMPELFLTQDGSYTLFSKQYGVTYHSKYGAVQESNHVFIESGLLPALNKKEKIRILEIGFGTGLNVLLSWQKHSTRKQKSIDYHSFDIFPLPESLLFACQYPKYLNIPENILNQVWRSCWDDYIPVDEGFCLKKYSRDILEESLPLDYFDVIFFDAFSPESQPELWSPTLFEKLFKAMQKEGILVTYCAKGEVKRTLKSIGFHLEALPGPPGKREMTRATKPSSYL